MSLTLRKKALWVGVVLCMLWPAAHFALARNVGFDPWKFFGWAMYSCPAPEVEVSYAEIRDGRPLAFTPTPELAEELRRFADRRAALGNWADPAPLVQRIFQERPDADAIALGIRRWSIDPKSGLRSAIDSQQVYPAGEP